MITCMKVFGDFDTRANDAHIGTISQDIHAVLLNEWILFWKLWTAFWSILKQVQGTLEQRRILGKCF